MNAKKEHEENFGEAVLFLQNRNGINSVNCEDVEQREEKDEEEKEDDEDDDCFAYE